MIVVDTSALMAILLNESPAARCIEALNRQRPTCISAGTLTEAPIVGKGRGVGAEMATLIDGFVDEIVPIDEVSARRAADAYMRWGKGCMAHA